MIPAKAVELGFLERPQIRGEQWLGCLKEAGIWTGNGVTYSTRPYIYVICLISYYSNRRLKMSPSRKQSVSKISFSHIESNSNTTSQYLFWPDNSVGSFSAVVRCEHTNGQSRNGKCGHLHTKPAQWNVFTYDSLLPIKKLLLVL